MNLRIPKYTIGLFAIGVVIFLKLYCGDVNYMEAAQSAYQVAALICSILILLLYGIKSCGKSVRTIVRVLIFHSCLFGVLAVVNGYTNSGLAQFFKMLTYLLVVYSTVVFIKRNNCLKGYINTMIIAVGVFILIRYIQYGEGLAFVAHLDSLFERYRTYINTYGMYSHNTIGNIALCYIIICFISICKDKKTKNIQQLIFRCFKYVTCAVSIIVLISSASRSNITGLVVFLCIWLFLETKYEGRLKFNKFFVNGIIRYGTLVICGIVIISSFTTTQLQDAIESSQRLNNFTINIPQMLKVGNVFTGMGLVESGDFGNNVLSGLITTYVDNYYLYIFLTSGIIGSILILVTLILAAIRIKKITFENVKEKKLMIALFVTILYCGMFETCIFYPTFISCFIYWVLLFSYFDKEVKELKTNEDMFCIT